MQDYETVMGRLLQWVAYTPWQNATGAPADLAARWRRPRPGCRTAMMLAAAQGPGGDAARAGLRARGGAPLATPARTHDVAPDLAVTRPTRMRAMCVYSVTLGDSSVLEAGRARPADARTGDEVRVRLAVAGVNPTDWKFRAGADGVVAALRRDRRPGQDGAGVVDEVGNGVYDVKAGDRVWVFLAQHDRPLGTASRVHRGPGRARRPRSAPRRTTWAPASAYRR